MSHVTLVSKKVVSWVPQSKNVHLRQCWALSGVCVYVHARVNGCLSTVLCLCLKQCSVWSAPSSSML